MSDKTTTNREALVKIAQLVRPALANQAYIPALTHIKFDGEYATTFNDVSSISVRAAIEVRRCVPGDLLIRALGSFGGESIAFQEGKDSTIVLSSGRSKIKLPTLGLAAFPFKFDVNAGLSEFDLDASIMKGIERCLLSVGNDPTHPAQMGVTLDVDGKGNAVLFSTDNFTISRYQTKTKIKLPGDTPVILPTFFCEQAVGLAKTFKDEKPLLVLQDSGLLIEFGKSASLFTKTLVDLEPLDFPRIVEKHCKLSGLKDQLEPIPDGFDGALGRAMLVLSGEVDKVTKITMSDAGMKLNSSSAMGDSDDSMPFDGQDAPEEPFYIDPGLLARAAKVCASMALLPKVVVLTDSDAQFVHLVAHCSR